MTSLRTHRLPMILGALVALGALLLGGDPCALGSVTGRMPAACAMPARVSTAAPSCHGAGARAHDHCATPSPAKQSRKASGGSCCELKPMASAARVAILQAPAPAVALVPAAPVAIPAPAIEPGAFLLARDVSPPSGPPLALHSGRAPPLS